MKVLVIHATAGAGHKKAAEAIYNGLLRHTTHKVQLVDSLDYTNAFFKFSYPRTYVFLVTQIPTVWRFAFWLLDIPFLQPLIRCVRRCYNGINTHALVKFLKEEKFDCIISTHFLSAEVSAYLKRTKQITAKVICTVTDFDVHRIWITQGTDIYLAACDYTKSKIVSLGVSPDDIFETGIPTDERFGEAVDPQKIRESLKVNKEAFTVLLATGSFGTGPIEELIHLLKGYQLLVVCGHNKGLYEHLKAQANPRVHVFGLVNNMHEMMAAANVMVTKPGGLSIAEALVKKLPLIFFNAIPGQEMGNIRVLKKYEVAKDQGSLANLVKELNHLSANPQDYENLRQRIAVLAKPNAVRDITKLI